jgi:hypothetical protein
MQPISLLKYVVNELERLSPDTFRARQASVRQYIKHEGTCELLLKIDAEKLQKKFKSEPTSLYFISLELSGLLSVEVGSQLIQWLHQTPPNDGDCAERPYDCAEKPCGHGELPSLETNGGDDHRA